MIITKYHYLPHKSFNNTVEDFICTSSESWKLPPVIRYKEIKEIVEVEEGEEEEEDEGGDEKNDVMMNVQVGSTDMDPGPQEPLSVCAIDCEMCYTKIGLELTRVLMLSPYLFLI